MKKLGLILIVTSLVLALADARTQEKDLETFYRTFIDQKIGQCDRNAAWVNSWGAHMRRYGDRAKAQAQFYRECKEELLLSLKKEGIGRDPQKVEHYLIKAATLQKANAFHARR